MRRRIIRVAITAVVVAMLLFAVPLAIIVRSALFGDERRELERAALTAAVRTSADMNSGDPVELPSNSDQRIGVYDHDLRLLVGRAPSTADAVVRRAAHGAVADGEVAGSLVVAVPVTAQERVIGVVRAAQPVTVIWARVGLAWLVLGLLAGAAFIVAVLASRRLATHLSRPLERLAASSERVASGDLAARAQLSDIPEIGRVAEVHNTMVQQLGDMLERARHFSTDASHQLRTPLAGLQLGLEAARSQAKNDPHADLRSAVDEALEQAARLHRTVEDLLRLTQVPAPIWGGGDLTTVDHAVAEAEERWHGPLAKQGRPIDLRIAADIGSVQVAGPAMEQILDVLLDNATRHGRGAVTISARLLGETVAVDVSDEGTIDSTPEALFARGGSQSGHGIGLHLGRSLAESCGGRLRLTDTDPTTFGLLLPGNGTAVTPATASDKAAPDL